MKNRTAYKNTWQKGNCDRINITLHKGRKAEIKAAADAKGQSLNAYINEAIDEKMGSKKDPSE